MEGTQRQCGISNSWLDQIRIEPFFGKFLQLLTTKETICYSSPTHSPSQAPRHLARHPPIMAETFKAQPLPFPRLWSATTNPMHAHLTSYPKNSPSLHFCWFCLLWSGATYPGSFGIAYIWNMPTHHRHFLIWTVFKYSSSEIWARVQDKRGRANGAKTYKGTCRRVHCPTHPGLFTGSEERSPRHHLGWIRPPCVIVSPDSDKQICRYCWVSSISNSFQAFQILTPEKYQTLVSQTLTPNFQQFLDFYAVPQHYVSVRVF